MTAVKLGALVLLVSLLLGSGLAVEWSTLRAVLRNGRVLARAVLGNFVVVPLAGVILTRALHLDPFVATGILLMAIAPGVPLVLAAGGTKHGGNEALAVTLALVLPAVSVITIPLYARLLLPLEAGTISTAHTLLTLALFQLLPLIAGMTLRARAPALATRLEAPLHIVFLLSLLTVLVLLAPTIGKALATTFGTSGITVAAVLVAVSLGAGWLLGGSARDERVTMSIGTALRNVGAALAIATDTFAGTTVAAAVLAYLVVQAVLATAFGSALKRRVKRLPPPQPIPGT